MNTLYEQAFKARLATEKFMLDGRHTGTGGGNHIAIGAAKPADSPLLRRPDLLRSLINYWQHHPVLSYLFSSDFVGPTSQAPRIDEGATTAFTKWKSLSRQVPETSAIPFAPLVDRIFRHLLTDITGNTHRSEFCIDKLYSPDSRLGPTGPAGIARLRYATASRMSLTQQLLLRSLMARFWKQPYTRQPIDWDTQLHDRFMLPHFVEQDFRDVIADRLPPGTRSSRNGSRRIWNFAFRSVAAPIIKGWTSKCGRRWNRGMCSARKPPQAARCAMSILPWNGFRSKCAAD